MRKRLIVACVALATIGVSFPLLLAFHSHSELDRFLVLRGSLLNRLDANARHLPAGIEHVIPPHAAPTPPLDDHIRSVVRRGEWYADNYASYDLRITNDAPGTTPREIVVNLCNHLQTGIAELGLKSPRSGGPDWLVENRRAAHSQYWRDPHHRFIVTLSVVVDADSRTAHVTRYVHERMMSR